MSAVTAEKILETARDWLGYSEASGKHKQIIDIYNSHKPLAGGYSVKYTDNWCDTFVSAVAIKAGAVDIIGTECGCERHIAIFKSKGIWNEDGSITPKPGDIIVWNWDDKTQPNDGWADHIGYVESVSGKTIQTIEGNRSNSVGRRTLYVGDGTIRGFARPKYAASSSTAAKKTVDEIAKEVLAGQWGTGDSRRIALTAAGYNYSEIQKKVNAALSTKSIEAVAKEVIAGKWGNGDARKKALIQAGYNYSEVQKKVNELL